MPNFSIETRKSVPGYDWSNTWHVQAASLAGAVEAGDALSQFERALLGTTTTVVEHKVSPWPNPSNQGFVVTTVNQAGQRSINNPMPAEIALLVGILTFTGRKGRKWFRYSLDEAEVFASGKNAEITTIANIRTAFAAAAVTLGNALSAASAVLMVGADSATARLSINELSLDGVGARDVDVGWYNRAP